MKKFISILLSLALLLSLCSVTAFAEASGDGSKENPYIIMDAEDFDFLVRKIEEVKGTTVYAELGADITATSNATWLDGLIDLNLAKYTLRTKLYCQSDSRVNLYDGKIIGGLCLYNAGFANIKNVEFENTNTSYTLMAATYTTTDSTKIEMNFENCLIKFNGQYVYSADSDTVMQFTDCSFIRTGNESYTLLGTVMKWQGDIFFQGVKITENINTSGTYKVGAGYDSGWNPNSRGVEISYAVQPTYTVTIPSEVKLGESAEIKAEQVVVEEGKQVAVKLTGTSGDNNAFTLKSAEGAVIDYTVQDASKQPVSLGGTVLTVNPANSATGESTLSFIPPTSVTYAGTYTGTVTFTISVVDVQ